MNYKHVIVLVPFLVLLGCGGNEESTEGAEDLPVINSDSFGGLNSSKNISTASNGAIAYVSSSRKRNTIRLIQSDGSNDKLLWTAPDNLLISPHIGTLAWKPDGTELAFDSDHSFGMSLYGRDLYTITADGSYLRKITNPPEMKYFKDHPKGTVQFTSANGLNNGGDNFWAYVEGSSSNKTWLAASWQKWSLTFNDVVDFGAGVRQHAVVGYIGYNDRRLCRYALAAFADINPGSAVKIVQDLNMWEHQLRSCLTVYQPSWSHNGEEILYTTMSNTNVYVDYDPSEGFENYSIMLSNTENLLPGNVGSEIGLFAGSYVSDPKYIKLSPTPDKKVLLVMYGFPIDRIYLTSTDDSDIDSPDRLKRIDLEFCNHATSFGDKCHISAIEWLPDGNGFIVAMKVDPYDSYDQKDRVFYRLYRHNLNTGNNDMLVNLESEYIGNITVSPSADKIAFERGSRSDGPYDIWVYDIEDDSLQMLVEDAAAPAWAPL